MSNGVKLEVAATAIGLVGACFAVWLVLSWSAASGEFSNLRQHFRGGSAGAWVLGISLLAGFGAALALVFNVCRGARTLWWLRTLAVMVFIVLVAWFASHV